METMRPMPGDAELDAFAKKNLRVRLPELISRFKSAPEDAQRKFRGDFAAVIEAAKKYDRNPTDCPLGPRDLVRVTVALRVRIDSYEDSKNLLQKPGAAQPRLVGGQPERKRARGSAGPHPVVVQAKRMKLEARDGDTASSASVPISSDEC
eukprot:TRINITY_DN8204_c0_g8_i1.p3 TRINITY_DN8204_c0_g8~~TRINITY_DN8204_c0_g8_i1.p3  ORF type:complete len:151 (+),score=55.99 TRINITY_DN8204_c0_g8_i1:69-521(+)